MIEYHIFDEYKNRTLCETFPRGVEGIEEKVSLP